MSYNIDFDIKDFLPMYPNINQSVYKELNPYPDFYKSLTEKKELYDLKLTPTEDIPVEGGFLNHQKIIARFLSSHTPYNALLLVHEMGCLAPDTKVLLWDGNTKQAKDIKLDDILIGDDGNPRNILELKHGKSKMYEINQTSGCSYTVNENHILTLRVIDNFKITFNEKIDAWCMRWLDNKTFNFKSKTIMCTQLLSKKYALERLQQFRDRIYTGDFIDIPLLQYKKLSNYTKLYLEGTSVSECVNWGEKPVSVSSEIMGEMCGNGSLSNIPPEYIYNSKECRLGLLRGYIKNKYTECEKYITISERNYHIANDICFVFKTLGISCHIAISGETYNNIKVFKRGLSMIIDGIKDSEKPYRNHISVKETGGNEYFGWTVDMNGRFLLADTTVTHNSGKSCTAVAVAEQIKKEFSDFRGVVYLAPNKNLVNNFILEIVYKCTNKKYVVDDEYINRDDKIKLLKHRLKNYYEFYTFYEIAKLLEDGNYNRFSNKVIIIDEIHNLRETKAKDLFKYKAIKTLCKTAKNTKILLMSGTPMRDSPAEIAPVMNLILRDDLPIKAAFEDEFLLKQGRDKYIINPKKVDLLKRYFKGRVSYLTSMESNVKKVFMGQSGILGLTHFIVDTDTMSPFQTAAYKTAYESDTANTENGDIDIDNENNLEEDVLPEESSSLGFYNRSRQATLFVYPNGMIGTDGFKHYFKETVNTKSNMASIGSKITTIHSYKAKPELLSKLKGSSDLETLSNIQNYSSKYAKAIKQILENPDKCTFVYCEMVEGSGSILFGTLLELFGYSQATSGNYIDKRKRYAVMSYRTTPPVKIQQIKNRFNEMDNMNGEFIHVIIGSSIVSEGFSLNHIQEEHVLTPFWNYTSVNQAIARGLRVGSHRAFTGKDITVRIYQHLSIPLNEIPSIDGKMYVVSENKDKSIKYIERLIKESAVDCTLFYARNRKKNVLDGSRECEYGSCDYKCDGVNGTIIVDSSTYNLYYASDNLKAIIGRICELFRVDFYLHLDTILTSLNMYNKSEVFLSLREMIEKNQSIKNKYGFVNYLREENNIFFLVENISMDNSFFSNLYAIYPLMSEIVSFDTITHNIFHNEYNIEIILKRLLEISIEEKKHIVQYIPKIIQEMLVEVLIMSNNPIYDEILSLFEGFIRRERDIVFSSILLKSDDILRCLVNGVWRDCNMDELQLYFNILNDTEKKVLDNPIGVSGIYDNMEDKFYIVDSRGRVDTGDKRLKASGKECTMGWTIPNLIKLLRDLKVEVEDIDLSRNELIERIKASSSKNIYTSDEIDTVDISDLKRVLYWGLPPRNTKSVLCGTIRGWLEQRGYVLVGEKRDTKDLKQISVNKSRKK